MPGLSDISTVQAQLGSRPRRGPRPTARSRRARPCASYRRRSGGCSCGRASPPPSPRPPRRRSGGETTRAGTRPDRRRRLRERRRPRGMQGFLVLPIRLAWTAARHVAGPLCYRALAL